MGYPRSQHCGMYIASKLYPWVHQPIPNLNETMHKKTLLEKFLHPKSFQLCILGNFSGGSELKDATCFARIHHLRLETSNPWGETSHDEDRGSIHQNSRRVIVDINGQPNCIQENHTLGGSENDERWPGCEGSLLLFTIKRPACLYLCL